MTVTDYRLRDGSTTTDPRLGRLPQFDDRSRRFAVRELTQGRRRSYTWSIGTTLNQGSEGACVGMAWTHELLARPAVATGVGNRFARETVYWGAQRIDPWEGGAYPGAAPAYEGTSVLAGAKVCQSLGAIGGYRWAFGLDDLIEGVGYTGPAVLGIAWHDAMYRPGPDGFIRPTGPVVGGHAILCRAVSLPKMRFTLRNSWGLSWGLGGDCYVSFDDMAALLADSGEACFATGRRKFTGGD